MTKDRKSCRHSDGPGRFHRTRLVKLVAVAASVLALAMPALARAQTDYYNTDAGRPVRIEDAYPTERHAFELQLAPLRLERSRGGVYQWGLEPALAYGILPRTHLEIGFPLAYDDLGGGKRRAGLAGIDVSVLHNLNAETRTLPAFGLVGEAIAPVGGLGPDKAYAAVKGIVTRTYRWARFHVNGQYTFGASPGEPRSASAGVEGTDGGLELSRWLAGAAVDRTFPLRSTLITAELYARQPIFADRDVEWNAGAGVRHQLAPQWALDGGVGRRLNGDSRAWYVTFGAAYAFGLASLFGGSGE